MYSFYGGRPGNSFVIVATYESVADMVANFKLGPNYADVHYDEHVIINTINKNNPENGKIYRRGYDFNNEMGGAEYIGTIVGPAGNAPMLEMTTIQDINSKAAEESYQERFSSGTYAPEGGNLIPGKNLDGTFNDDISWACYSVRDANHEDTIAYIGFKIPYLVIDFQSSQVEPYVNGVYGDVSSVTRIDDGQHPFYQKLQINIPKGIKGDALKNLRVVTATADIESYDGQADDVNLNRKVLVYDYYDYTNNQSGSPKKIYLGDYNMIEDISIDENGTIEIDYSHEVTQVWNKKLKWIKSVSLNENTGAFKVIYNQSTDASEQATEYNVQLDWVKDLSINNDGTVTINYTKTADKTYNNLIKWVTGITLLADGTMQVQWNTGAADTIFSKAVKWINSVNIANDGTLTIGYNNGADPTVYSKIFKWISTVELANDGTLTINYNNDSSPTVFANAIKSISNIAINTGANEGEGSQKLAVTWNNSNVPVEIGNPINYIIETVVDDENNLLVWYSDPVRRALSDISYDGKTGWVNIGRINPAAQYDLAQYIIQDYDQTPINGVEQTIQSALSYMSTRVDNAINSGQPIPVTSPSQMTQTSKIYLYQGPTIAEENQPLYETGYLYYNVNGEWQQGAFYGNNVTVDAILSDSSINPVQNKVLSELIGNLQSQVEILQQQISGGGGTSGYGDYIVDSGTAQVSGIAKGATKQQAFTFNEPFQDPSISPINVVLSIGTANSNTGYHNVEACLIHSSVTATGFTCYVCNGTTSERAPRVTWMAIQKRVGTPE